MNIYGTSASCPKCGKQLYTMDIPGYSFVCPDCDENFYTIEIQKCMADYWEVNFPLSEAAWQKNSSYFQQIAKKYNCTFCSYDPVVGLMDIGWEKSFPMSDELNRFVQDVEAVL